MCAVDGWPVTKDGGPGRISVARLGSPSRWGGCTTCTPGIMYTGILAMEVILNEDLGPIDPSKKASSGTKQVQDEGGKQEAKSQNLVHSRCQAQRLVTTKGVPLKHSNSTQKKVGSSTSSFLHFCPLAQPTISGATNGQRQNFDGQQHCNAPMIYLRECSPAKA